MARGRVNPLVPAVVILVGLAEATARNGTIGAGICIGAALAYVNGLVLSRRVDLASLTGNVGAALLVMQMGLLITLTIVGVATIVLVKISVAMAVASAAGFGAAQIAILAMYYWTHGRRDPVGETKKA